jgi:hypothetical protein
LNRHFEQLTSYMDSKLSYPHGFRLLFAYGRRAGIDVTNEAVRLDLLRLQEPARSLPNQKPGERYCQRCAQRRRVLMNFMLAKEGWSVSFLEEDCKTVPPRHFVFQSELKILDLAQHGGAEFNLVGRQAIEHGISMGRRSVWLKLTREQYDRLRR